MKKLTEFLEKQSQWLAVALGGLWLLYMIYANVLASSTATVDVKGTELGPGSVDQFIQENAIAKLKSAMEGTGGLPPLKNRYASLVADQIALRGEQPVALDNNWMSTLSAPVVNGPGGGGGGVNPNNAVADGLPVVPAPLNVSAIVGKSIISLPPGAGGAVAIQKRLLWASVFGVVPMADLNRAFQAVKLNQLNFPPANQTLFLKIEVVRTEQLANGAFGNPVTIATVPVDLGAAAPANPPPTWPKPNDVQGQLQYKASIAGLQRELCQPAFYTITKGDSWHLPGVAGQQIGVQAPAVVAPPPPPLPPTKRTPPVQPPFNRGPGGGGPSRGGPRGMAPINIPGQTTENMLQVFSDMPGTPMSPGGLPGGMPGAPLTPGGTATTPLPPANAVGVPPVGVFSPSNANDVNIWVHDTTVENGRTYQYQIRYTILNPLFKLPNLCPPAHQAWADQFSIDSQLSAAAIPVVVPDTTTFFANNYSERKSEAKFDIYVWDIAGVARTTVPVTPGELLDPNLRLTFVDARKAPNDDWTLILMDENGTLITRDLKADRGNWNNAALQREAANPAPAVPGQ